MDMMTKNQINEREQLEMLTIEQLVPQDHLVRKLDEALDFSFIYPLVEDLYSTIGRPDFILRFLNSPHSGRTMSVDLQIQICSCRSSIKF
jgi:hypothetical protein